VEFNVAPPLDWLSRLLEMMPVRGQLELRCQYGAPWRIVEDAAGPGEIRYHVVLAGSALLNGPGGGPPTRLAAGDILLLPHGSAHVMHDGSGAAPVPARDRQILNVVVSENLGDGAPLDLLCGRFVLTAAHDRLLKTYLPPQLVVHTSRHAGPGEASTTEGQLANLVALMQMESLADKLGGHAMLSAFSTAMFALILRLASEGGQPPSGLLAIAGNPRLAPALTAIFHGPDHPWTLPELAGLCGMSRATLSRHFQEALGRSASDLLTDIRMTLAANRLRSSSASTGAVAEGVGYQSEAAFQRVFKQVVGVTPAQWRRSARADRRDAPRESLPE
jgi:AraC family transcriptional activator of mtrCDE